MPPIRYYNQTGPFWDFVASLEEQGASHPLFGGGDNTHAQHGPEEDHAGPSSGPGGPPPAWTPWGVFPHRGRNARDAPPPDNGQGPSETTGEKEGNDGTDQPTSDNEAPHHGPHGRGHRHGHHHGPHARGGFGGRCGRGGGRGRHGRRGFSPYGGMGPFGPWAEAIQGQLFGGAWPSQGTNENDRDQQGTEDFSPDVDVFDTTTAFVVHVSLPGAKKEDVGVSWDAERSEVKIAGVVHRPGDEAFLNTLAMGERQTGAFERKVRLGSRVNPAQVDIEGIVARLEDGVLRIEVPKLEAAGFVEIRKVDIE